MKRVYIAGGVIAVFAWLAVGLFVAKGPQPEIVVPAESLFQLGPLHVTNTLLTAWFVMAFLVVFTFIGTRSMKVMPSGLQNFIEGIVGFVVDQVVDIAGEANGRRFFMVTATFFLFIVVSNWAGLLPFFNAIGKTEDVGHEIFAQIASTSPTKLTLGPDGTYTASHKFGGAKSDKSGGVVLTKNGAKTIEFTVRTGDTPGETLDRYMVFLAQYFAGYSPKQPVDAAGPANPLDVKAAFALLGTTDAQGSAARAPRLVTEAPTEHGEQLVKSPALGSAFGGVSFTGSPKLTLVVPFFRSVFSDVNNTIALGICSFLIVEFWGFQSLGFGYLKKFFNFSSPIGAFVGVLELLSEFIRIISFAFRLFGNIFAGEVLVLMLTFLMPFLFVDIIYGLELFVGFIQAAVFALLTLVFAVMAVEHHGEEEHQEGHQGEDAPAGAHQPPGAAQAH